jgi:hypothetical protein
MGNPLVRSSRAHAAEERLPVPLNVACATALSPDAEKSKATNVSL